MEDVDMMFERRSCLSYSRYLTRVKAAAVSTTRALLAARGGAVNTLRETLKHDGRGVIDGHSRVISL